MRDLALAFHSRFLFLRHSIFSGSFPFWDPYPANGQPAVNDALYQLFHLPSLAVRLLLPEIVAYNLWVALPDSAVRAGMYLFLRRHVSRARLGVRRHRLRGVRTDRLDAELPELVVVDRDRAVRLLGAGSGVRAADARRARRCSR